MTLQSFIENFHLLADALNSVPKLRELILQLAVEGKLAAQDSRDEPASKLLQRIKADREKLAKTANGNKKVIADAYKRDKLITIPKNWEWVHFDQITNTIHYGYTASANELSTDVRLLRITDIQNGKVDWESVPGCEIEKEKIDGYKLANNDILIARTGGTIGKSYLVEDLNLVAVFASYLIRAIPNRYLFARYLKIFLESELYWKQLYERSMGTGQPNVNATSLKSLGVPLPPLEEQKRIVRQVDDLMALCDELEAHQQARRESRVRLNTAVLAPLNKAASLTTGEFDQATTRLADNFDTLYDSIDTVSKLRATILQLAVQGKLVAQDSNDEPASVLLQTIKQEQKRLLNDGKIKSITNLPPIDFGQVPFALPAGWTWSRFPELGEFSRGRSKHRPRNAPELYIGGKYKLVQTGDVARANGVITTFTALYNQAGLAQSRMWPAGTMCITIAANIADSGILGFDACFPDSVVGFVPSSVISSAQYFEYFMRTAKSHLQDFAPSTAQKNINIAILQEVLIPLPPLAEQKRIVAKVNQLISLCDQLEAKLRQAEADSEKLMNAAVKHVLECVRDASKDAAEVFA